MERRVELRHADEAMATLTADLPAEVASAAYARTDRCAHTPRNAGDGRTMDQLRADVFADLLLSGTPGEASVRAEIFVYIDVATLIGLAENPAELAGHGPLPASIARAIAFDPSSTWRRIITDPHTGAPIDVGRTRYRRPPSPPTTSRSGTASAASRPATALPTTAISTTSSRTSVPATPTRQT
ncbi:DUF222 domain-containing protein [Prauserella oleivorans]|uniref:DUF222 domain-containing protein n=1 Tax=Prauserella oleivorans TaxID=1478153 RepID=A0ABW5WA12_9PSEU